MGDFIFESLLVGLLTAILLILMLIAKFIFDLPSNEQWHSSPLYFELRSVRTEIKSLIEEATREIRDIKDATQQLCQLKQSSIDEQQENEFKRLRVDQLQHEATKQFWDK